MTAQHTPANKNPEHEARWKSFKGWFLHALGANGKADADSYGLSPAFEYDLDPTSLTGRVVGSHSWGPSGFYIANSSGVPELYADPSTLAGTASGEGAALVGVEDAGDYYTGATAEAVLQEIGVTRTYSLQVTIAAAAVATLNATPVSLVPAPGAGYYIEVVSIHWWLDYATTAYDAAGSGDTLVARYTDGSGAIVVDAVAGDAIGAATADYHTIVKPVAEVIPVANAALVAHITTGEWFSAAGDSPLKAEVVYRVRPFTW